MKTQIYLCLILLLNFDSLLSQNINKEEYSRALSYFATGNSFNSVGNYAALSTANNTLSASFYFLDDNSGMYTIDVQAGASQGIATLFDQGELNSNVQLGFSYRWAFGEKFVGYDAVTRSKLHRKIETAEEEYILKQIELLNTIENPKLTAKEKKELKVFIDGTKTFPKGSIDIALNKEKLKKFKKINDLYIKISNDLNNNDGLAAILKSKGDVDNYVEAEKIRTALKAKRDQLIKQIKANNASDKKNRKKKAMYVINNEKLIDEMNIKKKAAKKSLDALKPLAVHLNFLSFGYKARNNNFIRFIESSDSANQLKPINYIAHNFNVSYNFITNVKNFANNNFNVATYKYLSIGANLTYSDNQSSLEQVEVVDTRFVDSGNSRTVTKTQKAFLGDYQEDLAGVNLFVDYYSFFSKNSNFAAIHINPTIDFKENQKPVANVQLGLLIPFSKKKDQKSVVNVEIFYRFKDVFNTMDANNTLLNRSIVGLQTSFPFNF
ncbi:hypothetical protein [Tenacibaculum jejuense]|nr:hypothetical protein [Tenacibaculum jejuense]